MVQLGQMPRLTKLKLWKPKARSKFREDKTALPAKRHQSSSRDLSVTVGKLWARLWTRPLESSLVASDSRWFAARRQRGRR